MTTLYVDNIAPNLASRVSVPGHVIQVVENSSTTQVSISNDSTFNNILSASITPTSTDSKIIISISMPVYVVSTDSMAITVFRDTTNLFTAGTNGVAYNQHDVVNTHRDVMSGTYSDLPNTTSPVSYSIRVKASGTGNVICPASTVATITLMEIAG
jgi:hypothetical protein